MSPAPEMIEVALAALLHDVGKVYERTGEESEALEHIFGYSHATFTSRFFEDLQRDEKNHFWDGLSFEKIKTLASYHHRPNDPVQEIIAMADRCSAGERQASDKEDSTQNSTMPSLPYGKSRRPLVSLFSRIRLDPEKKQGDYWCYNTASVSRWNKNVFPHKVQTVETEVGQENYRKLYNDFYERIRRLNRCPTPLLVEAVIGVCRSCWSLIPSSARSDEIPDITLYDHSAMTAAIACTLFAKRCDSESAGTEKKMLLVSGDVSGIQDFLLDLPDQAQPGTAKILRARSFYIAALSRAAIIMILDHLGLPACNCIRDAGGQFTLLVQNTPSVRRELSTIRQMFDNWMLRTFQGRLALVISDPVEINDTDFQEGRYGIFADQLKIHTDHAKKQKFHSVLQSADQWDLGDKSLAIMDTVPPDKQPLDDLLKRLGGRLTSAKYMTLSKTRTSDSTDKIHFFDTVTLSFHDHESRALNNNGILAAMAVNPNSPENDGTFSGFSSTFEMARHVPRLNAVEAEELNQDLDENEFPWEEGQVKPFDRIAATSEGVHSLAVLKADVDRLGQIFSRGLDKDVSISRLAVLSRLLSGFFTGVLEHRLQTEDSYSNVYTEYAGGDDLLFVGPWNVMFQLALDVRQRFAEYTCHNEDITLSASIVLGHAKSPIASLVRQAESLLDQAKSDGRNRIALFDTTLPWSEYEAALQDGRFLFDHVRQEKISKGFPYRLLRYYQMYQRVKEKGSICDLLWKSQLRYDMARNLPDPSKSPENQKLRDRLDVMTTIQNMDRLKIAATYALYLGR